MACRERGSFQGLMTAENKRYEESLFCRRRVVCAGEPFTRGVHEVRENICSKARVSHMHPIRICFNAIFS